jgi:hypothetical protein
MFGVVVAAMPQARMKQTPVANALAVFILAKRRLKSTGVVRSTKGGSAEFVPFKLCGSSFEKHPPLVNGSGPHQNLNQGKAAESQTQGPCI